MVEGGRRSPANRRRQWLSDQVVDALPVGDRDIVYWDKDLPGFGVRVYATGSKSYLVRCRDRVGARQVALGRHGVVPVAEARTRGAEVLARIRAGLDPRPGANKGGGPTVADIAERYLREHVAVRCKPLTLRNYRYLISKHVLPALGPIPVAELERRQVAELHYRLRKTPVSANDAVNALSRMLNRAEAWGIVPPGSNPCRRMRRYRTRRPERFLTEREFRRLGGTLDALEAEGRIPAHAAAALRLLMLTGCRCGEILGLRWADVQLDQSELRLADSKTGPRTVSLSPAAVRVLAGLPRPAGNPWVIAGAKPGARLTHITYYWYRVRKRARLEDVRLHDLRHSFASRALALGEPLPVIARLLGHTKIQTTARYAHLARDSVRESADRVAASIAADILPPEPPKPRSGDPAFRR